MKSLAVGCFALFTAAGLPAGANVADMSIACTSLRVPAATASDVADSAFEIRYTSDFSEAAINSINGEWYQAVGTVGYESAFTLESLDFGFEEIGYVEVEIPSPGDLNFNFLTDFFEVDRAVSGQTGGTIHIGDQSQPVTAVWNRDAGQTTGSLTVSFPGFASMQIGDLSFTHTFEIFQYTGKLTYTPAAVANGAISATVSLSRVGGDGKFTGPFPLKLAGDGTLLRLAASWTNSVNETFDVLGSRDIDGADLSLFRVPLQKQYDGSFYFVDGIPATEGFQDEFDLWDVFINDPNDADLDGIADLGDVPAAVPPEASLVWVNDTLQLGIKAKAGTSISIERRANLTVGDWATAQTFVLATDNETVVLPNPGDTPSFWRVTVP